VSDALDLRAADPRAVAAATVLPAVVGVVALVEGYPVPRAATEVAGALGAGVALAAVGTLASWSGERGLAGPATVAALALLGGTAWALLAPGVSAARVGGAVVVSGDPVLARFAGVAPLLLVVCGCAALVEGALRRTVAAVPEQVAPFAVGRLPAAGRAAVGGAALVACSLAPGVLLGDPVASPALLGFAAVGGGMGGAAVAYLWLRHRLLAPLVVLAVAAGAAVVGVTRGGSPRGFPLAWLVWLLPAFGLGGLEAVGRWLRGRVSSG
jgi:hypothetical protein